MTRTELVARIAEAHPDLRQEEVRRVVDTVFDSIGEALSCQRRSKTSPPERSKTSPLNVMRYAVLGGCPGSP